MSAEAILHILAKLQMLKRRKDARNALNQPERLVFNLKAAGYPDNKLPSARRTALPHRPEACRANTQDATNRTQET